MWLIEMVSWLVGPTVGGIVDTIITCAFGIFVLLWNISPFALIGFFVVLAILSKLSRKLGALVFGLGMAYTAYSYNHPIIATIFAIYAVKELFSSSE